MEGNTIVGESTTETTTTNTETTQTTETSTQENKTLIDPQAEGDKGQDNQSKETDSKEAEKEVEYQDFKMPEGLAFDDGLLTNFKAVAKDLKLNQDQAQRLVDVQASHVQEMNKKIESDFKSTLDAWKQETIKELGPSLKTDQSYIAKAIDAYGTPELKNLLNQTGLGNNKEVVKLLINAGKNISNDKFIDGKGVSSVDVDMSKKLYPNLK